MAKTITLTFPHDLTQDEVQRRITSAIADARSKNPELLKDAHERWIDNQMDFTARVMGQSITGRVVVEPKTVTLSVDLPFMLSMLAGKIKPQIESEGRKLLEKT